MNVKHLAGIICAISLCSLSKAQVVYSDNFDSGVSDAGNWNINNAGPNNTATFGFDYSTVGIPSAPGSGGTTIGLRLAADYPVVTTPYGISVSPVSLLLGGSYHVTFDFWQNFNGNAAGTGSGTTQITGAGIGTSGTTVQYASVAQASLWFGQTGDGGNAAASRDYKVYSSTSASTAGYTTASGVYAAGTGSTAADNANAYYASLGGNTVPAGQTALTATQTGTTAAGAPGFKWHVADIFVNGSVVTYSIDGLLIATVSTNGLALGGGNIELIQSDISAGASTDPNSANYAFGLFDNIEVTVVPEPATCALAVLGAAGLFLARRRKS